MYGRGKYRRSTYGDIGGLNGVGENTLDDLDGNGNGDGDGDGEQEGEGGGGGEKRNVNKKHEHKYKPEYDSKNSENHKETKDTYYNSDRNDVSKSVATRENKNEGNIVILPFPFNVLGGVPYYHEEQARYLHRPFMSGCVKEVRVRRDPGSRIPLLLSQYFNFHFNIHVYNYIHSSDLYSDFHSYIGICAYFFEFYQSFFLTVTYLFSILTSSS
jgi:hypothetical protein